MASIACLVLMLPTLRRARGMCRFGMCWQQPQRPPWRGVLVLRGWDSGLSPGPPLRGMDIWGWLPAGCRWAMPLVPALITHAAGDTRHLGYEVMNLALTAGAWGVLAVDALLAALAHPSK